MTADEALRAAIARMEGAGVAEPARDARRLLAHVLGIDAGRVALILPEPLSPAQAERLADLADQRARRVPVSQLTGRRAFYGRDFEVNADVLDPRPETEILVAEALSQPFIRVLDLGTGSGAILLTLLAERGPEAFGIGTDLSAAALAVAHRNAGRLGVADRAQFRLGDWWDALRPETAAFDLIVSNPPYIAADEMVGLAPEVRDFEPRMALTDEGDGLGAYRRIVAGAPRHLDRGGWLRVEIGPTQAEAVAGMMRAAGFEAVAVTRDLDGRDRVVAGRKPRDFPR